MGEGAGSSLRASPPQLSLSRRQRRALVALSLAIDGPPKQGRPRSDSASIISLHTIAILTGYSRAVLHADCARADVRAAAASLATLPDLPHRVAVGLAGLVAGWVEAAPAPHEEPQSQGGEGAAECASLAGDDAASALAAARARLARQRHE